jgi:redox-sensing transcriptional repressor
MVSSPTIPDIVIGRLPIYLRALTQLLQQGHTITSSHELGKRLGISSAQIRKDLSHFGDFGKQGTGYQVSHLLEQLKQILHVNHGWNMIIVGAGDLGRALAHYRGFAQRGFRVVGVFDNDIHKEGTGNSEWQVMHTSKMGDFIREHGVRIAMLAVPAESAQAVCDTLVEAGVRAILNYAPITLNHPNDVHVQYIDPVMHLQRMTYYLEE